MRRKGQRQHSRQGKWDGKRDKPIPAEPEKPKPRSWAYAGTIVKSVWRSTDATGGEFEVIDNYGRRWGPYYGNPDNCGTGEIVGRVINGKIYT